jgi:Secretion system C-terminal sorting domain/Copper binding proteins, plastocyanin/azurin family
MKNVTLFLVALLVTTIMNAQTTYNLDWAVGINGPDASLTIETGDTVEWTWTDALPHSVTSVAGSAETFDSGIITGLGNVYSYTFTVEGVNDYECVVHSNMFGTITVEQALSIDDKFAVNVNYFPNPVTRNLTVTSLISLDSYQVYDILGKQVQSGSLSAHVVDVDMSQLKTGVYFVKVQSGQLEKTMKVIKK